MGQISVEVNHNTYTLACRDGEEERLEELARYVASKANGLSERVGQVGEARLMLMVSILLADELRDARDQMIANQRDDYVGGGANESNANPDAVKMLEQKAAAALEKAAGRLEGIVAGLENT